MDARIQAAAFRDNIQLPYAGLAASALHLKLQEHLLELIELYVGRMRDGHARVKMAEVARHLPDTHFVWVGGIEDDSAFYYRIHSPVVLIEFDHLNGIAFDNDISGNKVTAYAQRLGITYPIGYSSSVAVDGYLGRDAKERLQVPQIVVIDRKGVIRAQSRPVRELNLEDENYLRNLIDTLLKENAPATKSRTVSPSNKASQVGKTRIHGNL